MKKVLKLYVTVIFFLIAFSAKAQITPPVFDENVDDVPITSLLGAGLVAGLAYGAKRKINN